MAFYQFELLKGTTALAFFNEDTIKIAADTRGYAEKKILTIHNTDLKVFQITKTIYGVMVGDKADNLKWEAELRNWLETKKKEEIEVIMVANYLESYMNSLLLKDEEHNFGNLIAGYDNKEGAQIYRVLMKDKLIINERATMIGCLGSGAVYASQCLVNEYKYNASTEEAKQSAFKSIFMASYYDKSTDGNVNYYTLSKHGLVDYSTMDCMKLYSKYYEDCDEQRVLFLAYSDSLDILSTEILVQHFLSYGALSVAHCVDHRQVGAEVKKGFYFHRLIFESREEAAKVLKYLEQHCKVTKPTKSIIGKEFNYQMQLENNVNLLLCKASKQLVDYLIEFSSQKLNYAKKKK